MSSFIVSRDNNWHEQLKQNYTMQWEKYININTSSLRQCIPQCIISEFPYTLRQITLCYHWLSVPKNAEINHCGILFNRPVILSTHTCSPVLIWIINESTVILTITYEMWINTERRRCVTYSLIFIQTILSSFAIKLSLFITSIWIYRWWNLN